MKINSAEYLISNAKVAQCPATEVPEYAFIGRSNVGKSSLINMLTGRKSLAKTSQTPGKTLLINHFSINKGQWYIVDLPGYGYAARGKKQRDEIRKIIENYVLERPQMTLLFVLVDSRHAPQKIDLEFMEWLGENQVPFAIVFTKSDKQGPRVTESNIATYKRELLKQWEELPPIFITSSVNATGRDEILDYIDSINQECAQARKESETDDTLNDTPSEPSSPDTLKNTKDE
ncbi:MAG: ribosome biogenesis GTP-binding protein YihA/YsxC [Muribaculaceae bacterium]|nr:ribosome biogenesis GTP-binding protein YihA/YsxC [Muribaculaceae bacterium]